MCALPGRFSAAFVLLCILALVIIGTESYWGGAVAGLGAALMVGAFGRLRTERGLSSTAALGIGALLLLTSRPFESSALIVPLCMALIPAVWKGWHASTLRAALPLVMSLAIAPIVVLAYNYGVTGNALRLPYVVHFEQYGTAPLFWFQAPPPPKHFENAALQDTSVRYELATYKEILSNSVPARVQQNLLTVLGITIFDGGGLGLVVLLSCPCFSVIPRFACLRCAPACCWPCWRLRRTSFFITWLLSSWWAFFFRA